ncbi:DASS family sodium-coupled anion symporter [Leptobacterium flavescens]|uniref:DASS family sodium-coupled anion symporter n=1 Tax=Leptobacterium flavescens TaxID=472055 RepID=A0A6P0UNX2_9FLAO|nr:DASS family sodium-coupled anion symporter [Leptobacterium flavescens]NER12036.1 DASS family sodium-coupled anion symporter [Leptobacterium flavescens]
MTSKQLKKIGLVAGPVLFFYILFFFHPEGLSKEANAVLASTAWVAIWWILEVVPIAVTAMLPIILFPLSGALGLSDTTTAYGHKYIFLYIGGFILAIAIEKWNLHRRIALHIINLIGTSVSRIILGFMCATAFLSMWISNTATSVMMLPIGMAIVSQLKDNPDTEENETMIFGKALMLAIAYSASIGGVATLIGTPPNIILAGILQETYGIELTFVQWLSFGLPISIILLFICWKYLTRFAFSFKQKGFPGGQAEIKRLISELGKISFEEKLVLAVFILTALCWILRSYVLQKIFPAIDDTIIVMIAAVVLFILPSRSKTEKRLVDWESAVKLPWGVLLLFGGGLALAQGFTSSGLARWIGDQLISVNGISLLILVAFLIAAVNFLTEITSNLATTSMLLPIIVPVAFIFDVHPFVLMVGVTVAASCAFMLPVATPPNAVVFGSGYLRIPDMLRTGIWMNIISIILLTLFTYYVLPLVWDFVPDVFPEELKK